MEQRFSDEPYFYRHLRYFERDTLLTYRNRSSDYEVDEDDAGGCVDAKLEPFFFIQFGHRTLADGETCLVVLDKDLASLPPRDLAHWHRHEVRNDTWATDDPDFRRWIAVNFEIDYGAGESGLSQIHREVLNINAVTRQVLGQPLWGADWHPLISYPTAENTERYAEAAMQLFRLLIDAMQPSTLAALGNFMNMTISKADHRLKTVKELLPQHLHQQVCDPLSRLSNARNKMHGVRTTGITSFPARQQFHDDVMELASSMTMLRQWLEDTLHVDSERCRERQVALDGVKWTKESPNHNTYDAVMLAKGRTIVDIRYGITEDRPVPHRSEAIILRFDDGSETLLEVGSNVKNILTKAEFGGQLLPSDFDVHFRATLIPAISKEVPKAE